MTGSTAKNAVLLVAMSEDILAAGAADDGMTPIAGDSLRAIVPEQDFSVAPDQVHSGLQAVQDSSEDGRVLKFSHRRNDRFLSNLPSASGGKASSTAQACRPRLTSIVILFRQFDVGAGRGKTTPQTCKERDQGQAFRREWGRTATAPPASQASASSSTPSNWPDSLDFHLFVTFP
jgi:hypothetical protein